MVEQKTQETHSQKPRRTHVRGIGCALLGAGGVAMGGASERDFHSPWGAG